MAYSYVKYTGNGVTTTYVIPFVYLSSDYLEVSVNDVLTTAYTLPTSSSLQFTVAPPNGQIVEIRRNTPKTARLVDFQDASILTEAALDLDSDQAFHITQETYDLAVDGVGQAVTDAAAASSASASAAATSEANAAASLDSFDDRYLGAKAVDPTLDNDGNALLTGALYWNTASNTFKAWTGSAWATFTVNAQPLDAQLTTLAGITAQQATDLASVSTFIGTLLNDADEGTAQATLGLATVSQPEAEAGVATTTRAWTAERVAQAIAELGLGGGVQTWQTVSRTAGATHTNSTGRPIMLSVSFTTSANNVLGTILISVSGGTNFVLAQAGGSGVNQCAGTGSLIIPTGATYMMTHSNVTSVVYTELR